MGTLTPDPLVYSQEADLPDIELTWRDSRKQIIDFSADTFELRIGKRGQPAIVTKTGGIDGAATAPNVTIAFDDGELDGLDATVAYSFTLIATRDSDSRDRVMTGGFVLAAIVEAGGS